MHPDTLIRSPVDNTGLGSHFDTSPSSCDGPCSFVKYNSAIVASGTYMWTKSLRWVLEYTYGSSASWDGVKITSNQGALGMMLFF